MADTPEGGGGGSALFRGYGVSGDVSHGRDGVGIVEHGGCGEGVHHALQQCAGGAGSVCGGYFVSFIRCGCVLPLCLGGGGGAGGAGAPAGATDGADNGGGVHAGVCACGALPATLGAARVGRCARHAIRRRLPGLLAGRLPVGCHPRAEGCAGAVDSGACHRHDLLRTPAGR